jgi:hypothetical protein
MRGSMPPLSPPSAAAPKATLPDEGVARWATPGASAGRVGCAAAGKTRVLFESSEF